MAGKFEGKGTIGMTDSMKPTLIWQTRERNGKHVEVPFMTFKMHTEDYTRAMVASEDGTKRRQREVVQVILQEDQRSQNLFKRLAAGRKVLVRGRLTHRPNIGKTKDGNAIAYPNPVVYLDTLEFLDEPIEYAANRVLNVLRTEAELINDEQSTQMLAAITKYAETLRTEIDERIPKSSQQQANSEPSDPDDLGLQ